MAELSDKNKQSESPDDYSFTREISTATLIRLLISKGILTSEEIIAAEKLQRIRQKRPTHSATYQRPQDRQNPQENSIKLTFFKKFISRHRRLRKLTSALFGWQWKKVKVKSTNHNSSNRATN
jgi:hypothetical protein